MSVSQVDVVVVLVGRVDVVDEDGVDGEAHQGQGGGKRYDG